MNPDEGFVSAGAVAVDEPGHQFFPHTCFSKDENSCICFSDLLSLGKNLCDSRAFSHEIAEMYGTKVFFFIMFFFKLLFFVEFLKCFPGFRIIHRDSCLGGKIIENLQV